MTVSSTSANAGAAVPERGRDRLSLGTLALHWLVGLSVIGLLAYGFWLQTLPTGPGKTPYVQIHKSFGILIFVIALARVIWRWREGFPAPAGPHKAWERRGAISLHVFLIAATILMPISGIVRSLAYARPVKLFEIPLIPKLFAEKQETLYAISSHVHDWLAIALATGIVIHIAAALKHTIADRDDTLMRILGGRAGSRKAG